MKSNGKLIFLTFGLIIRTKVVNNYITLPSISNNYHEDMMVLIYTICRINKISWETYGVLSGIGVKNSFDSATYKK